MTAGGGVDVLNAEVRKACTDLAWARQRCMTGSVSQSEYEAARRAYEEAKARRASALAALEESNGR